MVVRDIEGLYLPGSTSTTKSTPCDDSRGFLTSLYNYLNYQAYAPDGTPQLATYPLSSFTQMINDAAGNRLQEAEYAQPGQADIYGDTSANGLYVSHGIAYTYDGLNELKSEISSGGESPDPSECVNRNETNW